MKYQLIEPTVAEDFIVERVLTNRGINKADVYHYLHTSEKDLNNPSLLDNIDDAVKLLISHIKKGSKMFLIPDVDVDGFTSSAIFINYLHKLFPFYVENNISYDLHTGKQHGIELEMIPDDVDIVVMIDASSNDYEQHRILKERGIDVLVIDHHEAPRISTDAIVVNNQLCNYPNKTLCGAGVVFKFISFIDKLLNLKYAEDFYDLTALGEIADVMDLRDFETRYIVSKGLDNITNPFFKSMVEKNSFSLKDKPTAEGVAFYIAPYINATIRVGTQEEKLLLFESMLTFKAEELIPSTKRGCKGQMETKVEQACRNCVNIKNRQQKAKDDALTKIEEIIETKKLYENKIIIVTLNDGDIDKRITGLVANQIAGKYNHPTLILSKTEKGFEGSARNVSQSSFENFKDFVLNSGYSLYAEGHQNAWGCGISEDKLEPFIDYSNKELMEYDFSADYKVDFIENSKTVSPYLISQIADLNWVWGQGIKEPFIAITNIHLTKNNFSLRGNGTKKLFVIQLPNGIELIKFGSSEEEYKSLYSEQGCVIIDVVGTASINEYNNKKIHQIIIEDYEVKSRMAYYF